MLIPLLMAAGCNKPENGDDNGGQGETPVIGLTVTGIENNCATISVSMTSGTAASARIVENLPLSEVQFDYENEIQLVNYVKSFKYVFSKEGAQSLGGFGSIGNLFAPTWDWYSFWNMTALLSVMLAFMNILPIPVLDGGHVLFLIIEVITRRKPSDKFMEIAQSIGLFLLFALLIYANGNDIVRFFFK